MNIRNSYEDINNFYKVLTDNDLIEVKGSDSHDATMQFYKDMSYFKINSSELEKIIY